MLSEIKNIATHCVCNKGCCQARLKTGSVSETVAGQTKSFTSNSINKQTNKTKHIPPPSLQSACCSVRWDHDAGRVDAPLLLSPRNVTRPTGGSEADDVPPRSSAGGGLLSGEHAPRPQCKGLVHQGAAWGGYAWLCPVCVAKCSPCESSNTHTHTHGCFDLPSFSL